MFRACVAAAAALWLAACTGDGGISFEGESGGFPKESPAMPGPGLVYDCGAAGRISIAPATDGIALTSVSGTFRLGHVQAASGAKYAGEGVTFWTKAGSALLEHNGATASCVETL